MSNLKKILTDYGADYEVIMERFMENEEMYLNFLDQMFEDDDIKKMRHVFCSQDTESIAKAAHTLKGIIGTMGLTPLYNAICKVLDALRAGKSQEHCLELYKDVQKEFEKADALHIRLKEEA